MVREFVRGEDISTASVLLTTLLDLVRYMMFFAGLYHFKVGIWRICGYQVDGTDEDYFALGREFIPFMVLKPRTGEVIGVIAHDD